MKMTKRQAERIQGGPSLLKAGFQALLILAISAGVWQAVFAPLVQVRAMSPVQQWEVEYLTGGTIDLLADQLSRLPPAERQRHLDRVSPEFGFSVTLRDSSDVHLDSEGRERLHRGELVGDPADYSAYKQLAATNQTLVIDRFKEPAGHLVSEAQRRHMGTFAVLEQFLDENPYRTAETSIASVAGRFQYPIKAITPAETGLSPDEVNELRDGQIVTVQTDDGVAADYPAEMAYKQVGSTVLALGPFSPPTLRRYYPIISAYYAIFAFVILLPLLIWLAPTWRSMKRLSVATVSFGQGDFAARANTIRGSKTNYLIEVFNQMAGKIQSLVESNRALINSVSHELRTPISRIEFNIELARQSTDIAERNQQLDRIEASVDELKAMVSEMLQYARFDREKPNFRMDSVNIGEWLNTELENWTQVHSNASIRIDIGKTPLCASLERYYMSRAVSNLVRNASRFAESKILVGASSANGLIEISVSDDGPGIEYQERTRIFEPFVRLDESRNRESGGSGLGLAIVKQIAGWHAGDVRVEDSELGGAKFVISWPMKEGN